MRRKAAAGELPVPLEEKLEIMVHLAQDPDEEIRNTAFYTLQTWNVQELQHVLSRPATPLAVLDFAANFLAPDRREIGQALLQNPGLPDDMRDWVEQVCAQAGEASTAPLTPAPQPVAEIRGAGEEQGPERTTLLQKINRMSVAEKIKTALTGNQEERLLLIRDANKIVARAVLQSPKVSEQEAENFASMKSA